MKCLIDAQLPKDLARLLETWGIDAIHTSDLPADNRTTDKEICVLSTAEQRIVVTKDADFTQSYLLKGTPQSLLYISTGNISNDALIELFRKKPGIFTRSTRSKSLD